MEHFIECVHRYPCLWNTAAIEYRDQELKDAAWAEVLKETDLSSVKEAKLRWKKLRDSYRDALKREEAALSGAGAAGGAGRRAPAAWKHAQLMAFLAPHMGARKRPPDPEPAPDANGDSSSSSGSPPPPARRHRHPPASPAAPLPLLPAAHDEPLAAFFGSMCMATRRLPLAGQLAVKRALFAAVMRAESAAAGLHAPASSSDSDTTNTNSRHHNDNNH